MKGPKHYIKLIAPKTKMEAICTGKCLTIVLISQVSSSCFAVSFQYKDHGPWLIAIDITMNMAKKTTRPKLARHSQAAPETPQVPLRSWPVA